MAFLADAVVVLHLAFLAVIGLGALAVARLPKLAVVHVPALAWAVVSLTVGVECPLTNAEKTLRAAASETPYRSGFVDHYLEGGLIPASVTPVLWAAAAVLTVAAYARLVTRRLRV